MLVGLLMLFGPIVVYLVAFPSSRRMKPTLCWLYRIVGGIIVVIGSAVSFYFAAYTGDQGGIGAFYFQLSVISLYALFSVVLVTLDRIKARQPTRSRRVIGQLRRKNMGEE
jgi:uncharacterized YccA/Bax inhibitor family protein